MAAAIAPLTLLPNGILQAGVISPDDGGIILAPVVYSWYLNQAVGGSQPLQVDQSGQLNPGALGVAAGSSVRVEAAFSQSIGGSVASVVVASSALTIPLASGPLVDVRIVDGSSDPANGGLFREGTQLQALIPDGLINPAFQWYRIPSNAAQPERVVGATTEFLSVGPRDAGVRYVVDVTYGDPVNRRVASAPAVTITVADNGAGVLQLPVSWADASGRYSLAEGTVVDGLSGIYAVLNDPDGKPSPEAVVYSWIDALNPNPLTNTVHSGGNYQPGPLDAGKVLRLQAVYRDLQGNPPVTIQSPSFVIRASENGNGQLSAIAGSPTVDNTLSAGVVSGDPDTPAGLLNTPIGYQWFKSLAGSASLLIDGATAPTYVPTASDVGSQLTVRVSTRDSQGFDSDLYSAPITVLRPDSGQGVLSPIVGSSRLGSPLTAGTVSGDPDGIPSNPLYSYQWQTSTDFGGSWINVPSPVGTTVGTGRVYQSTQADLGAQLRVRVTYPDALNNLSTLNSAPITVVDSAGPLEILSILNANPQPVGPLGTAFIESDQIVAQLPQGFTARAFQWFRNGFPIPGAGESSYPTKATDAGQFTVQAYGLLNGSPQLLASPIVSVQAFNNGAAPLDLRSQGVSPYRIGDLLQASIGVDVDGPLATPVTYVWERRTTPNGAWEAIANATGHTYTVVAADSGAQLRARASYFDAQGFSNESISADQLIATSSVLSGGAASGGAGAGAGAGGGGGGGLVPSAQPLSPTAALRPAEPLAPTAINPHSALPLAVQIEFGFVKRGATGADDEIIGTSADDVIANGAGAKRMRGLEGRDGYLFDQSLTFKSSDVDTIVDFASGIDQVFLEKEAFPRLAKISFGSVKGKKSLLKEARKGRWNVVYQADNGSLWYDANGSRAGFGSGGHFASLENAPLLTAADLRVAPQSLV